MAHLIDKDTLVAEIENLENTYKKCPTSNSYEEGLKDGRLIGYKDALHKINTLEVKEVDLEKDIDEHWDEWAKEDGFHSIDFAKHFFELGLRVQKGE